LILADIPVFGTGSLITEIPGGNMTRTISLFALLSILALKPSYAQTGACCVDGECVGTMEEWDCRLMGGSWYGGETCPEFECPNLPCWDSESILWDNGDTDGENGMNMGSDPYRSLLEDFVVEGSAVTIDGFHQTLIWDSLEPPQATDFDLTIWSDVDNEPGDPEIYLHTTLVSEEPTGRQWFGRTEFVVTVAIEPVTLDPRTYWLEMHIVGPEPCWVMSQTNIFIGEPLWYCYEDLPPCPTEGCTDFFECYGVNFCLTGSVEEYPCGSYVVGDYNCSGQFNVADVVDMYSKLKTGSPVYPDCECDCEGDGNIWPVGGDVNNSCTFNIADVVIAYRSLMGPPLVPCELCPPAPGR
jgi:hypothetical protein